MSSIPPVPDNVTPAERRGRQRVPVRQACTFAYYSDDGHKLGVAVGMTVNVSENGMMLTSDKWLQPGMRVLVEVVSQLYMFMATAHVVHAEEIGDTLYQLGISYDEAIQSDWGVVGSQTP